VVHEWSLDGVLKRWPFWYRSEIKDGHHLRTGKISKKKFLETAHKIEPKLIMSGHWMVPCKLGVITRIGNPRWLPQQF